MYEASLCFAIRGWVATLALFISLAANAAGTCPPNPEREIVDHILNHDFSDNTELDSAISALDISDALIPEPGFYRGLAIWYRGYQMESVAKKKKGIQALRQVVQIVEDRYQQDLPRNHLIIGLVKAYTARALFENEQIVKGYYMGIDAVARLQKFIVNAKESTPGYHDARFLLALYSVYTHSLKTRKHWLIGTVKSVGNQSASIRHIHQTIKSNAVFAAESARSFLAEVNWRTPDICNYQEFAISTHKKLQNNIDLSLLTQGLLLKCGDPDTAMTINNQYHSRVELPQKVRQKILKARLRILVDQGAHAAIDSLDVTNALEPYRLLAIANALDVSMQRQSALKSYQTLIESVEVPKEIKTAASVRLNYPYRPAKRIVQSDHNRDLRVCSVD